MVRRRAPSLSPERGGSSGRESDEGGEAAVAEETAKVETVERRLEEAQQRLEEEQIAEELTRRRAMEEERRADEAWRCLQRMQHQRQQTLAKAEEGCDMADHREQNARQWRRTEKKERLVEGLQPKDGTDEDTLCHLSGWTAKEQATLQQVMRRYPVYPGDDLWNRQERWASIAAELPGRSPGEVVRRCRQVAAAIRRRNGPPLLRLTHDALFSLLSLLGGTDLCSCACACKELRGACHDATL